MVYGFTEFLQNVGIPAASMVVADSVLAFAPGRMEG